jgi:hypothetical protein
MVEVVTKYRGIYLNNRIAVLLGFVLFALAISANAFPLTGGNGEVNATVVGTYKSVNDVVVLDIISSDRIDVVLVDTDDKFYQVEPNYYTTDVGYVGNIPEFWRSLYAYDVPKDAEIKRVKITPFTGGDPFSIDWKGVPEVNGTPLSMKFYGLQSVFNLPTKGEYYERYNAREEVSNNEWNADVKLTNTGNDVLEINTIDFAIIDQFEFYYLVEHTETEKLMPAESMRTTISFRGISKLSRPVYLVYKPSNLKMDISSWS